MHKPIVDRKIKQIIPANGWFAAHEQDEKYFFTPLICFALCECHEQVLDKKTDKWIKLDPHDEVCPMTSPDDEGFVQNDLNYKGLFFKVTKDIQDLTNVI